MDAMDGSSASSARRRMAWASVFSALLSLTTAAFAGPDSARSTISLEIRARSVSEPRPGDMVRGSSTAPVTLVAFTDFHCPYCKLVQPTLQSLLVRYGDNIRIVHRDFPIARLHPHALRVHEAARCAAEQNGFWSFHDKVLAGSSSADTAQLTTYAVDAGLNEELFLQCIESGRYVTAIQQDIEDGIRLGVSGTPTFFINGRVLRGMHPLESFVDRIDAELRHHTGTSLTSHPAETTTASP